jgi:hypothetical protein
MILSEYTLNLKLFRINKLVLLFDIYLFDKLFLVFILLILISFVSESINAYFLVKLILINFSYLKALF